MVSDYTENKKLKNVTFIGVCTSLTATTKSMAHQVEFFKLKPFANMLDMGGATAAAYGVPANQMFRLVVIDHEGKIAYNAAQGTTWGSGPDQGKSIHRTQLEKSQKSGKGVLQYEYIPAKMTLAAHYFDLQQFGPMEQEIAKVIAMDKTTEHQAFADYVRTRSKTLRENAAARITKRAETDPVQSYREAMSFLAAYPTSTEAGPVKVLGSKLVADAKVKAELAAEAAYQSMIVTEMKKVNNLPNFTKRIEPLAEAYQKAFGTTAYGAIAKNAVEAHREAISKPK